MKKLHSLSLIKATLTIRRAKPTAAYLMVTILHFVVVLVVVLLTASSMLKVLIIALLV